MERLTIKRVICTHKITLQLLWQLMMPLLLEFCPKSYPNLFQEITTHASSASNAKAQITSLELPTNQNMLDEFAAQKTREKVNCNCWWSYIPHVYKGTDTGNMGPVFSHFLLHADIFFQIPPFPLC